MYTPCNSSRSQFNRAAGQWLVAHFLGCKNKELPLKEFIDWEQGQNSKLREQFIVPWKKFYIMTEDRRIFVEYLESNLKSYCQLYIGGFYQERKGNYGSYYFWRVPTLNHFPELQKIFEIADDIVGRKIFSKFKFAVWEREVRALFKKPENSILLEAFDGKKVKSSDIKRLLELHRRRQSLKKEYLNA